MCKLFKVSRSCYYNWIEKGCVVNRVDLEFNKRPLNIPCQRNSDRRNPITPELKF